MHGALAAVLVLTVVVVAFASAPPSLGVAEISPVARESSIAPPSTAGDDAGSGGRGSRGRASTTTTEAPTGSGTLPGGAAAPTTRVGRTRDCVGSPPRQTEDPMSPPCVATIFEGDNGGATSRGVNATEIRVAVPMADINPNGDRHWYAAVDSLFEHFNNRFELYGRRLVPVYTTGASFNDAVDGRAQGAEIASKGVFAAMTGIYEKRVGNVATVLELTRNNIVTVVRNATTWWTDKTFFDERHPYAWSVYPSSEDVQRNLADLACTSLAGHPARHAADASLRDASRRFGIVSYGMKNTHPTTILSEALANCTGSTPMRIEMRDGLSTLRTGLEKFRDAGVTTIICVCEAYSASSVMSDSESIGLRPEWLYTPTYMDTGQDETWFQGRRRDGQKSLPIRLDAGPRLLPMQARPWFGPVRAQVDAINAKTGYGDVRGVAMTSEFLYTQLLLVASGVQAAGPTLTPDTFAQALMAIPFTNAGAGQPPYWQGSAGFGPGDHSFYDDYNVGWWSDTAPALDTPLSPKAEGSWCYLGQASRYSLGTYPANADDLLFNPNVACR